MRLVSDYRRFKAQLKWICFQTYIRNVTVISSLSAVIEKLQYSLCHTDLIGESWETQIWRKDHRNHFEEKIRGFAELLITAFPLICSVCVLIHLRSTCSFRHHPQCRIQYQSSMKSMHLSFVLIMEIQIYNL